MDIFPTLRGQRWAIHKIPNWSTLVNRSTSGGRLAVPLWPNNPLWKWEWSWEVVLDDAAKLSYKGAPYNNTLYTDLQIIEAFYFKQRGPANLFVYQPPDGVVVGQAIADPDVNGNSELVHTIGGVPSGSGMIKITESVQELNGVAPSIFSTGGSYTLLAPGTTAPYEGWVIHWTVLPTPGSITANFTYYYRVAFSDDSQDYEQFTYNLWQLQSLTFEQVRVTTG